MANEIDLLDPNLDPTGTVESALSGITTPGNSARTKRPPGIRKPGGPAVSVPINQGSVPLSPLNPYVSDSSERGKSRSRGQPPMVLRPMTTWPGPSRHRIKGLPRTKPRRSGAEQNDEIVGIVEMPIAH